MKNKNLRYDNLVKSSSEIKTRFLTSRFEDPILEENYLSHILQNMKYLTVTHLILCNIIYISLFIYFSTLFQCKNMNIINSIIIVTTVILTIAYLLINNPFAKSYIELSCYFLSSISFMVFSYAFMEYDNEKSQALRIIHIFIGLKNLSLLIWSRSNFIVWVLFSTIHILFLIISMIKLEKYNSTLIGEIIFEVFTSIVSFAIKKFFDSALRVTYLQTIKFQKYFDYNKKLINCMSGLHITFSKDRLIYMNDNTKSLINSLMENTDKYKGNLFNNFLIFFLSFLFLLFYSYLIINFFIFRKKFE